MAQKAYIPEPLRLRIEPIISNAEALRQTVARELPGHEGLARAAKGLADAARQAEQVSRSLQRPLSLHRLPAAFLAIALLILVGWIYVRFFRVTTLTIAMPDRDAQELRLRVTQGRVRFQPQIVAGSREGAALVQEGKADLAFVQGGVEIDGDLPRLETPNPEVVLWFVREGVSNPTNVRKILTSVEGEGSHTVAQAFVKVWRMDGQVTFSHEWKSLADDGQWQIPQDVDAVFVVKDLSDESTLRAADRLAKSKFELKSLEGGARLSRLDYLRPTIITPGFLDAVGPIPQQPVATYAVATFLVARRDLTPRLLAEAAHLLDNRSPKITDNKFEPTVSETSDVFQGVEAFLGILTNIVLAFLALLGLEMLTYRRRFHELNSLISLVSVHQSSKDVLGLRNPAVQRQNLLYLSLCSDLLGLISMIAGYYTQENSSLLFNSQAEIIHQRCDGLKINIQLKILHALVSVPVPDASEESKSNST